ncbi:hypothetical protein G8A07_25480 [Roseateles sp. DAIF2]|uniref:hypothetical protein n=1 Tax=Roseateles sp. DAIF2 TaxID=2714952 RepID=UPI0018A31A72|nr:hypothetical protein [Roseateles sp. DAIF2]QPF75939.1 hypothetical protein G8A07_25480 [Roseateles sp. DAIF2]
MSFPDSIHARLRAAVLASLPCQAAPVQLALGALLSAQHEPVHTLIACSFDESEACLHVGAALDLVHVGLQRLHARVDDPEAEGGAALLGTAGNVLAGDYLTSGSFKLLVHCREMPVLQQVADAITRTCELECAALGRPGPSPQERAIPLGAAAARAGAMLARLTDAEGLALAERFGTAYAAGAVAAAAGARDEALSHAEAAIAAAEALRQRGLTRPLELAERWRASLLG